MIHNVILADDHAILRNGIKNLIETHSDFSVAIEADSYTACMELVESFRRGERTSADYIAVVDISFKNDGPGGKVEEMCGFEIIQAFTKLGIRCIAFSSHDTGGFVGRATSNEIGAKGFVSKNADEKVLLAALDAVANDKTYIQAELVTGLLEVHNIAQTFTKKEKLVADALTLHKTTAELFRNITLPLLLFLPQAS